MSAAAVQIPPAPPTQFVPTEPLTTYAQPATAHAPPVTACAQPATHYPSMPQAGLPDTRAAQRPHPVLTTFVEHV